MSRYDLEKFDPSPDPDLVCSICACVLDNPVESPCRHVFCRVCIERWLSTQNNCPMCRWRLRIASLKPVLPLVQNMINRLLMICDFRANGCLEKIALELFESHIKKCDYEKLKCKHKRCGLEILRKDIKVHEDVICQFREEQCPRACGLMIPIAILDSHDCFEEMKKFANECYEMAQKTMKKVEELTDINNKLKRDMDTMKKTMDDISNALQRYRARDIWDHHIHIDQSSNSDSSSLFSTSDDASDIGSMDNHPDRNSNSRHDSTDTPPSPIHVDLEDGSSVEVSLSYSDGPTPSFPNNGQNTSGLQQWLNQVESTANQASTAETFVHSMLPGTGIIAPGTYNPIGMSEGTGSLINSISTMVQTPSLVPYNRTLPLPSVNVGLMYADHSHYAANQTLLTPVSQIMNSSVAGQPFFLSSNDSFINLPMPSSTPGIPNTELSVPSQSTLLETGQQSTSTVNQPVFPVAENSGPVEIPKENTHPLSPSDSCQDFGSACSDRESVISVNSIPSSYTLTHSSENDSEEASSERNYLSNSPFDDFSDSSSSTLVNGLQSSAEEESDDSVGSSASCIESKVKTTKSNSKFNNAGNQALLTCSSTPTASGSDTVIKRTVRCKKGNSNQVAKNGPVSCRNKEVIHLVSKNFGVGCKRSNSAVSSACCSSSQDQYNSENFSQSSKKKQKLTGKRSNAIKNTTDMQQNSFTKSDDHLSNESMSLSFVNMSCNAPSSGLEVENVPSVEEAEEDHSDTDVTYQWSGSSVASTSGMDTPNSLLTEDESLMGSLDDDGGDDDDDDDDDDDNGKSSLGNSSINSLNILEESMSETDGFDES